LLPSDFALRSARFFFTSARRLAASDMASDMVGGKGNGERGAKEAKGRGEASG
jgi:hypothetical protein